MKLAEALIERADMQKKIAALRARMEQSAKVHEGETPAESVEELLILYEQMMDAFETIVIKINRTNSETPLGGGTINDNIARRDNLRNRITAYRELYDAAVIRQGRYTRSEIKFVRCIDTAELQRRIDATSKKYREIDNKIQSINWGTELIE